MTQENQKPSLLKRFALWLILLLVALIFVAVVGFQQFIAKAKSDAAKNMPESTALVTAMEVQGGEWTPVIEAVGTVRPNQGAMLNAQMAGTVTRILVKSGDRVSKGQLLVELDSTVENATLRQAEAQLPSAQANYNRYRNLVASNSASKMELDSAKATYDQLVANIDSLRATVKRRQIYAPFDGVAGIVRVNVGEYLNVGTEILRVEDQSRMKISFTLPQTELGRVEIGQKVNVTADAVSGETFEAQISAIDPAVDKSNGLVSLEALVHGRGKLMSGMFTRLRIELPTQSQQIVVPQVVVTYTMYGDTAYILQPLAEEEKGKLQEQGKDVSKMYRVKQVAVKTLDRQGVYAQISSGVNVGDKIVTSGFQRLRNNALVQVVDKQPAGMVAPEKQSDL